MVKVNLWCPLKSWKQDYACMRVWPRDWTSLSSTDPEDCQPMADYAAQENCNIKITNHPLVGDSSADNAQATTSAAREINTFMRPGRRIRTGSCPQCKVLKRKTNKEAESGRAVYFQCGAEIPADSNRGCFSNWITYRIAIDKEITARLKCGRKAGQPLANKVHLNTYFSEQAASISSS